jgi:hypothetical protein
MISFLSANWLWILVIGGMVTMHLRHGSHAGGSHGAGCGGGHANHREHTKTDADGLTSAPRKQDSSTA